jgi:ethanolamine permease
MLVGIVALFTGKTSEIITIACFGALCLYIVSMIAFFALRKNEPNMVRPFKVPLFPWFPAIALIIAIIALVSMVIYNPMIALIFVGIIGLSYLYFLIFLHKKM